MKCPSCHSDNLKVTDSRNATDVNGIRRRRECQACLSRFTTFETLELTIQVHKRDGRYEDFQKQKLISGLDAACHHTTISHEQVIALVEEISQTLLEKQVREINTTDLGAIVMQQLQKRDPIAYIRFACVYRRFKNVEELVEAIQQIRSKDEAKNLAETY